MQCSHIRKKYKFILLYKITDDQPIKGFGFKTAFYGTMHGLVVLVNPVSEMESLLYQVNLFSKEKIGNLHMDYFKLYIIFEKNDDTTLNKTLFHIYFCFKTFLNCQDWFLSFLTSSLCRHFSNRSRLWSSATKWNMVTNT